MNTFVSAIYWKWVIVALCSLYWSIHFKSLNSHIICACQKSLSGVSNILIPKPQPELPCFSSHVTSLLGLLAGQFLPGSFARPHLKNAVGLCFIILALYTGHFLCKLLWGSLVLLDAMRPECQHPESGHSVGPAVLGPWVLFPTLPSVPSCCLV